MARVCHHPQEVLASLCVLRTGGTLLVVRVFALILVVLLLPMSISAPSATACSTTVCCGATCPSSAPVNQVSCCQTSPAPDRAIGQSRAAQHFSSIGNMPVVAIMATNSHVRSTVISRGYSPPDRLLSIALLCSRQI